VRNDTATREVCNSVTASSHRPAGNTLTAEWRRPSAQFMHAATANYGGLQLQKIFGLAGLQQPTFRRIVFPTPANETVQEEGIV
jgi:hypothetical protein